MNKYNIAFCINDGYAPYVAVTAKSITVNNGDADIAIHILTDGISESNRRMICDAAKPLTVEFHTVDDTELRGLKDTWSVYTWYRILLPSILKDQDKVLYLDADVIVDSDITSLFDIDMTDKAVAGTIDIQGFNPETFKRLGYDSREKYICAGVLMMNLDYWRKENLTDMLISWARKHDEQIEFPDQDAINALCHDSKIILPMKYGVLDAYFHFDCFYAEEYREQLLEAIDVPVIIHYAAQPPWYYERRYHQHTSKWDKYNSLMDTPVIIRHCKEKGKTFREKVAILLDMLYIRKLKRWYITPEITDREIKERIGAYGH